MPGTCSTSIPSRVEYVAVAHSIPEANALAIRTPLGTVLHTGDWKIDPEPGVGNRIDEARLRALGDEGVDVLICNSTNILREGDSFSESDVARVLRSLIAEADGRVIVTTFASNVARAARHRGSCAGLRPQGRRRRTRDGSRRFRSRANAAISTAFRASNRQRSCADIPRDKDVHHRDRQSGRDARRHVARLAQRSSMRSRSTRATA